MSDNIDTLFAVASLRQYLEQMRVRRDQQPMSEESRQVMRDIERAQESIERSMGGGRLRVVK